MLAARIDTLTSALSHKRQLRQLRQSQADGYHLVELDSCFIRYREAGRGPKTLVLAVDPPITLECYDQLLALLAPDYHVYVFELPGFGYSMVKSDFQFHFEATIETLQELLRHWNAGPYTLAFPCASAFFSIALANQYPELVSHLAMIQSPNWQQEQAWKHRLDPHRVLNRAVVGQLFMKLKKRHVAEQWVKFVSNTPDFTRDSLPLIDRQLKHGGCYCLASAMQYGLPEKSPTLLEVTQPARLIYGEQDRSHKATNFETIRDYGHQISLHPIHQAGHFPELEAPDIFKSFIDELHQSNC
ncbi:MAG: hypothetical protein CL693_16415 [Cellvibrionaceae bacterium]|mgnify:FL=1|nr:hypothetical protein [Cellvibrionaceae bacterium]|tara:strand:+ start:2906 stop:3805 length:900 start_codon:yes stop_codon:yes gene_type:complete